MLRFSCEKALLQSAVNTTSRAVAAKSSIPALEGILLEGGDTLTLSGYNMQTGIRTIVDAQVQSPGRIVLSARLFGEMIRKMPDDVIVFAADENLSDSKMKRNIRSIDKGRARYYNYFSQQTWGARNNCDLLINTSGKDIKQISEAVAEYLKKYLFD